MPKEKPNTPAKPTTIDQYLANYTGEVRQRMDALRATIRRNAPQAVEKISWGMPTFFLNGNLIHFAAHKTHIGLYPGPSAIEQFAPQLADYKTSKGAIQLPNSQPLPLSLVAEIVAFRVTEQQKE